MGFGNVKDSSVAVPLCEKYADQLPVRENLIYLNHAAVAPLPRRTAGANGLFRSKFHMSGG